MYCFIHYKEVTDTVMEDVSFLFLENQGSLATAPVLCLAAHFKVAEPEEACDALWENWLDYILLPSTNLPGDREEGKPTQNPNYVLLARSRKEVHYCWHC